jgi:hypothetical protein
MRIVFRCDPAIKNELIRPVAAPVLPEWLRAMPRTAFSELRGIQHGRPRAILR